MHHDHLMPQFTRPNEIQFTTLAMTLRRQRQQALQFHRAANFQPATTLNATVQRICEDYEGWPERDWVMSRDSGGMLGLRRNDGFPNW